MFVMKKGVVCGQYIFVAFLVLVLAFPLMSATHSYAESDSNKKTESVETVEEQEPVETPEPEETPEPKEQEAEKIHNEVEQEIGGGQVKSVEVGPTGSLKIERESGKVSEKQVPASQSPVATLQSVQLGDVSLSVNANGTVSLVNAGVRIETNYPVIIDPQAKTVAIRTETGVTVINMFPSQILPQLSPADKPTVTQSVKLTNENSQLTYAISGKQTRRFMGVFPVEAAVKTNVSAKDGSVLSVSSPWYFRLLGFLYSV